MKLKSFLIIFLILGFFMVAVVRSASAEFDADVSIVSNFNTSIKTIRTTRNGDAGPLTDVEDDYFKGKAAISVNHNTVRVDVTDYGRTMQYGDVLLNFYEDQSADGADMLLHMQYTVALTKKTSTYCEFTVPQLTNADVLGAPIDGGTMDGTDWLQWVQVVVKDSSGINPVYSWLKYELQDEADPVMNATPKVSFYPPINGKNNITFYHNLAITADATRDADANGDNWEDANSIYLWLVNTSGKVMAQSSSLAQKSSLSFDIMEMGSDPNLTIRYTDGGGFGKRSKSDWKSKFNRVRTKGSIYKESFDATNDRNMLTHYVNGNYYLYVPEINFSALQTCLGDASADVYYDGNMVPIKSVDLYNPSGSKDPNAYFIVELNADYMIGDDSDDKAERWTSANNKIALMFKDSANKYHVLGAEDGVGPRLVTAFVQYDDQTDLTLKFSESINSALINTSTIDDIIWGNISIWIDSISMHPDDNTKLIVRTNTEITSNATINIKDTSADTIEDLQGNPAYHLSSNKPIAIERIIEKIAVVDINRSSTNPTTTIAVYFNSDMSSDVVPNTLISVDDPNAYVVSLVPGLEEDDNNANEAIITDANYGGLHNGTREPLCAQFDGNYVVRLRVKGVVKSTAPEDLPEVSIVRDIYGGNPIAPLRDSDKDARIAADQIGPYLKSASFNYNPTNGKSINDLKAEGAPVLSLYFSEQVVDPRDIDEDVISSAGGSSWSADIIDRGTYSSCEKDPNDWWRLDINLDPTESKTNTCPYSGIFSQSPKISILSAEAKFVKDDAGNEGSSPTTQVDVLDYTPLWIEAAEVRDVSQDLTGPFGPATLGTKGWADGAPDVIDLKFGKPFSLASGKFERRDKVIRVNGDPNILEMDPNIISNRKITLHINKSKSIKPKSNWTPTVTFDLDEANNVVINDDSNADNHLTEDFSVVTKDKVPPVLVEWIGHAQNDATCDIPAYDYEYNNTTRKQKVIVELKFSEEMDPNIWKNPTYAKYYFSRNTTGTYKLDPNVNVLTFLTSNSNPPASSSYSCRGNTIAVLVEVKNKVKDTTADHFLWTTDPTSKVSSIGHFDDLNANNCGRINLGLVAATPSGIWDVPGNFPRQSGSIDLRDSINPAMKSMRIYGTVVNDPNDTVVTSGYVFAFSREKLFVKAYTSYGDANACYFKLEPKQAFGACEIIDGEYHLKAYGKESISSSGQNGFKDNEPVILVVAYDSDNNTTIDPNTEMQIATTACLSNTAHSVAFNGSATNLPLNHPIDLGDREVIFLRKGWNLFSTSILGSYLNSTEMALNQMDPDRFTNYMYKTGDPLSGDGSMPGSGNVYEMKDISDVLFTVSNQDMSKPVFYDPATNVTAPVEDYLYDGFNETPSFCTGRGYYLYIDANVPTGKKPVWQVVLFGDKISDPAVKIKVEKNNDLIGQWGGVSYYTGNGKTKLNAIYSLGKLPVNTCAVPGASTYVSQYVDMIAKNVDTRSYDDIAINVCDINGDPVNMNVISSFYNYSKNYSYPSSWYSTMISYSDLTFVAPGAGYWLLIDAKNADGPFFVNYTPFIE